MASKGMPGFRLTLGLTMIWLGLLVLLPLAALVLKAATASPAQLWAVARNPRVLASLRLSLLASLAAAAVNLVFGTILAWVLVRYRPAGSGLLDALVDLPFALPTAVAGIALTKVYMADGWVGRFLPFKVAFTPVGVFVALVFIGLPFVVRTVQPVLHDLEPAEEEAAACLGASRTMTLFRVVLPHLRPALFTGFALALARGMGEYGSVIFISANLPFRTEIPPLLIVSRLEQFDYLGATLIACILLVISFALLFALQVLQRGPRGVRHA
jgi:sulfate transport system permease protein